MQWILELNKLINKINSLSQDFKVYAVGGFSRDLILKRRCNDIDLVVNKDALNYSEKIACALKSKLVILDDKNKIYRIILENYIVDNIDISLIHGKTIWQDLQNRDFTINAVAFDLKFFKNFNKYPILVNKNVLKDFKLKVINVVSIESFRIDPLRMLRAFRFAAELNFNISCKTLKQIKQNVRLISKVSPIRIKNEFFKILAINNSVIFIEKMDKSGLFSEVFTEVNIMKEICKKYYYHSGGLFQHSFETMRSIENILNNLKKYFPGNYLNIQQHFNNDNIFSENVTRIGLLKFAAFFHDNAKPETAKFEKGKLHFLGHEEIGAEKIKKIMSNLKFGKKDIEFVTLLIKKHMRPSTLVRNSTITRKAALKFFRDIGDNTPDLLILSMSDWHSYKELRIFSKETLKFQEKFIEELLRYYYELKKVTFTHKIIDGNMIMIKFNLKSGPLIGELLNLVFEAQQEGKVHDTDGAFRIISLKLKHIKQPSKLI
jgi:poly(A) polymerase